MTAGVLWTNLHEVRLEFRWPLLPNGNTGFGRQTFRACVGGQLVNQPQNSPLYFFEPGTYALTP